MRVKKSTIGLLTLFSLVAVISVYYLFEDNQSMDIRAIFSDKTLDQLTVDPEGETPIIEQVDNEFLQQLRMEIADERSQLKEQYT